MTDRGPELWKRCRIANKNIQTISDEIERDYSNYEKTIKFVNRYFIPKVGRPVANFHDILDILSLRHSRTALSQVFLQEKDFDCLEKLLCLYDQLNDIHESITNQLIRPIHRDYHTFFTIRRNSALFHNLLEIVKNVKDCIKAIEDENSPILPRVALMEKDPIDPPEKLWYLCIMVEKELHEVFGLLELVEEWNQKHGFNVAASDSMKTPHLGHEDCVLPSIEDHRPPVKRLPIGYRKPFSTSRFPNASRNKRLVAMPRDDCCKNSGRLSLKSEVITSEPEMNSFKWENSLRQSRANPFTHQRGKHYKKRNLPENYSEQGINADFMAPGGALKISRWNMREPPQTERLVRPPTTQYSHEQHLPSHRHLMNNKPILSKPHKSLASKKLSAMYTADSHSGYNSEGDKVFPKLSVSKETGRRVDIPVIGKPKSESQVLRRDLDSLRNLNDRIGSLEKTISQHLIDKENLRQKIIDPLRWQVKQSFDWLKVLHEDKEKSIADMQSKLDHLKFQRTMYLAKGQKC